MTSFTKIVPVILCGGSGTRLWPLSREGFPKQFLALSGAHSLFQQVFMRLQSLASKKIHIDKNLIVTNEEQRFLVLDQLLDVNAQIPIKIPFQIVLEPQGKNTAPALTLAALKALENGQDPILVVTPADQKIQDQKSYKRAMKIAIDIAKDGAIAILGIEPIRPEIGFGYIQVGKQNNGVYQVVRFTEKPKLENAKEYLATGNFFWNSGIFVLKASLWMKAIRLFERKIASATEKAWATHQMDKLSCVELFRPNQELFTKVTPKSIDYAVIEKCPQSDIPIEMVTLNAGWSDLGTWNAVWQAAKHNKDGNAMIGDVISNNSKNMLVIAEHRLVSTVDVDNLIVVETADAVLVANKDQSQNVKKIVSQLDSQKRVEKKMHRKVYRPWGWYDSLEEGDRFKVKHILVKPGESLSLQMHRHRAEHWIVVRGIAKIIKGDQEIILKENESIFIKKCQKHRLTNIGKEPLEIIEVQSGSILVEEDIVRFEDKYGR